MPRRAPAADQKNWVAYQPTLTWPINRVKASPANSRRHSDEQVSRIATSMQTFGWTIPLLVDGDDFLIAGEARCRAARLIGLSEVPVKVAKGWSTAMIRAYVIADNRLAEASSWADDVLRSELAELLGDDSIDATVTGFSAAEIEKLLNGGDPTIEVKEIHTGPVEDRFWISIRGPLAAQAGVLDAVKAACDGNPEIELDVGAISVGE